MNATAPPGCQANLAGKGQQLNNMFTRRAFSSAPITSFSTGRRRPVRTERLGSERIAGYYPKWIDSIADADLAFGIDTRTSEIRRAEEEEGSEEEYGR